MYARIMRAGDVRTTKKIPPMGYFVRTTHQKNTPYGGKVAEKIPPMGVFLAQVELVELSPHEKNTPYGGISPKKYPLWDEILG